MPAPLRWYGARLRAMSPQEVAWRAGGPLRLRVGASPRGAPDWSSELWAAALRGLMLDRADAFVRDGERVAAGELDLWGHRATIDPRRPPWQSDVLAGSEAGSAGRDWERDLKPGWELHRQQHLFPLAAGAAAGARTDWAELCATQILDWIARNPPGDRPAWASGYETSHRLVGWAWTLPLIAERVSSPDLKRISDSYRRQADFVARRPSRYSSANNHRLAELTGLLAAATVGVGADRWQALWTELEEEAARQTYTDGGSREQAGGYFLYVVEILWVAGVMARAVGRGLGRIEERLHKMLEWLDRVADDRGEPPPVGDDAEDRLIRIDYFEPRRAGIVAGRARALLEGRQTLTPGPVAPSAEARRSTVLPESGYAAFRGSRERGAISVLVDFGELGYGSVAPHGHADALSVLVAAGGEQVLRDSGTYSYAPAAGRDSFRVTSAHNTVTVDGASQAEPAGPHLWGRRFRAVLEAHALGPCTDYLRASHDGYLRQRAGATHTRSVAYLKPDLVLVLDRVDARSRCTATLNWQLMPDEEPGRLGRGAAAMVVAPKPAARAERRLVPFSERYASLCEAPRYSWSATGEDIVFATLLAFDGGDRPQIDLHHDGAVTTVEIVRPRPLRFIERWRGPSPAVEG